MATAATSSPTQKGHIDPSKVLLHPQVLHFLETEDLVKMTELCKDFTRVLQTDSSAGYWPALCASLTGRRGLYSPHITRHAKSYFFEELWKLHSKWSVDMSAQDFKIRVSTRFRPGEKSGKKFSLPLHQFLKVRNQQKEKNGSAGAVFIGDAIPEHMQDALLGTIMHQPVLLPDSQKVLDRSVAVSCVLRGGKDPFTGTKLTMDILLPLPDLAAEIAEFKVKQANIDIGVDEAEVMGLVDDIDPQLMEALVAAEQLNYAARRAHMDFSTPQYAEHEYPEQLGGPEQNAEPEVDEEVNPDLPISSIIPLSAEVEREDNMGVDDNQVSNEVTMNESNKGICTSRWGKMKAEKPKIIDVSGQKSCVTMNVPGSGVRPFYYNKVFPAKEPQLGIYNKYARDIVVAALNGQNGCLLCYGQTSSGKTYTMFGPPGQEDGGASLVHIRESQNYGDCCLSPDPAAPVDEVKEMYDICSTNLPIGIVLRSCAEIMRAKKLFERRGEVSLSITAQYVEIYAETVTDLLSGERVSVRRSNGELSGATERSINHLNDLVELLRVGNSRKHFAATKMNDRSSRSHTALVLHLSQSSVNFGTHLKSALYLVDLAGSERVKKSGAAGIQMKEAKAINFSLLVLGKVIKRLSHSDYHVPYYESQLTTMLKGAFGGNSRTGVIVTCRSDDKDHGDETLQSLRFGELCGMITNSTRQTASSVESVLECLDKSIQHVSHQMEVMSQNNKQHLPSFQVIKNKLVDLKAKRSHIAMSSLESSSGTLPVGAESFPVL